MDAKKVRLLDRTSLTELPYCEWCGLLQSVIDDGVMSKEHAGCYLCNFNDEYMCTKHNGVCKHYDKCKEIHNKRNENNA